MSDLKCALNPITDVLITREEEGKDTVGKEVHVNTQIHRYRNYIGGCLGLKSWEEIESDCCDC